MFHNLVLFETGHTDKTHFLSIYYQYKKTNMKTENNFPTKKPSLEGREDRSNPVADYRAKDFVYL